MTKNKDKMPARRNIISDESLTELKSHHLRNSVVVSPPAGANTLDKLKQKYSHKEAKGDFDAWCTGYYSAIEDVRKEIHDRIKELEKEPVTCCWGGDPTVNIDELVRLAGVSV